MKPPLRVREKTRFWIIAGGRILILGTLDGLFQKANSLQVLPAVSWRRNRTSSVTLRESLD